MHDADELTEVGERAASFLGGVVTSVYDNPLVVWFLFKAKKAERWALNLKMGRRARRAVLESAAANIHAVPQLSLLDSKAPSQQYRRPSIPLTRHFSSTMCPVSNMLVLLLLQVECTIWLA